VADWPCVRAWCAQAVSQPAIFVSSAAAVEKLKATMGEDVAKSATASNTDLLASMMGLMSGFVGIADALASGPLTCWHRCWHVVDLLALLVHLQVPVTWRGPMLALLMDLVPAGLPSRVSGPLGVKSHTCTGGGSLMRSLSRLGLSSSWACAGGDGAVPGGVHGAVVRRGLLLRGRRQAHQGPVGGGIAYDDLPNRS
jgi:hypothetical protein